MIQIPTDFKADKNLLKNRIILITGATGGFGKVVSLACAEHGATVILLAKNLRLAENLYDEIEKAGYPTPAIYPMNLEGATEHDYLELAENIGKEFDHLDGLIHCAGLLGAPTPFEHSDAATWYQLHQVNLHAPYLLTRSIIPLLKKSAHGSIVFMTDDKQGAYWDAYMVTKSALNGLASLMASEYQDSALHVNSVNPGMTKTGMHLRAYPALDKNETLAGPEAHTDIFLYLMSEGLRENGEIFGP